MLKLTMVLINYFKNKSKINLVGPSVGLLGMKIRCQGLRFSADSYCC